MKLDGVSTSDESSGYKVLDNEDYAKHQTVLQKGAVHYIKLHTVGKCNKFDHICVNETLSFIKCDARLNHKPISIRSVAVAYKPDFKKGEMVRMMMMKSVL
jgi:hypothetical protein